MWECILFISFCTLFFSLQIPGCDNVTLVHNGFCNDETNNLNCNYDGGDCCGYNINSEHCTECTCFHQETCLAGVTHAFVGDGICNDETNIAECSYDNGDCCGYNINSEHCTECTCFHQETCLAGVTHAFVGDGVCNDETNIAECDYDGGDCCGYGINSEHCNECNCYALEICTNGVHPLAGNGLCNDDTNIVECSYDGGDCCGSCVNTDYCTECQCLSGSNGFGIANALTGNGFCNDETNNEACMFDGGDCCGYDYTYEYDGYDYDYYSYPDLSQCTECACYGV